MKRKRERERKEMLVMLYDIMRFWHPVNSNVSAIIGLVWDFN